jgi:hypothetical protein
MALPCVEQLAQFGPQALQATAVLRGRPVLDPSSSPLSIETSNPRAKVIEGCKLPLDGVVGPATLVLRRKFARDLIRQIWTSTVTTSSRPCLRQIHKCPIRLPWPSNCGRCDACHGTFGPPQPRLSNASLSSPPADSSVPSAKARASSQMLTPATVRSRRNSGTALTSACSASVRSARSMARCSTLVKARRAAPWPGSHVSGLTETVSSSH